MGRFGGTLVGGNSGGSFGGVPVEEPTDTLTYQPPKVPPPIDDGIPQWGKDKPNLYGAYGAGKALITEAVKPSLETVGAIAGSLFSPIVGTSLGYGIGKKTAEILEDQYARIEDPNRPEKTMTMEIVKSAIDVGSSMALGKGMEIGTNKFLTPIDDKITAAVQAGFKRGVKPTVSGKGTAFQVKNYYNNAERAVKEIIRGGNTPKNMEEFSKSIFDTKVNIYNKYHEMAVNSGKKGIKVDLNPVIKEMEVIGRSAELRRANPSEGDRLLRLASEWKNNPTSVSPVEAEKLISEMNSLSQSWWKNPNLNDVHAAINYERIAHNVRKSLNKAIGNSEYKELKHSYGALSSIEKEVTHRATVFGRRNPSGFFDLAGIHGTGHFIYGLAKMEPASMVSGAAMKGAVKLAKYRNNPDRIIKKMFGDVEKYMTKKGEISPRNPNYIDEPGENFIGENLMPEEGVYRYQPKSRPIVKWNPTNKKVEIIREPKQEANLSKLIRTTPKIPNKQGATPESIKAFENVNRFRKTRGLPPVKPYDYMKQRDQTAKEILKDINRYRRSKGLPEF